MNQRGSVDITLLGVLVIFICIVAYIVFANPVANVQSNNGRSHTIPTVGETNNTQSQQNTFKTPVPTIQKTYKTYRQTLELTTPSGGYRRLYFSIEYPDSSFSFSSSSDETILTFKEISTGKINVLKHSYEGGGKFSLDDYWSRALKPECPDCVKITNPITMKDVYDMSTFSNNEKEFILFTPPGPWVFVAKLQKPSYELEKVLSTFYFIYTAYQN